MSQRRPKRRVRDDPYAWLDLVVVDGPFLSRPALKAQYADGLPRPDAAVDDVRSIFRDGFIRWEKAWTTFARSGRSDDARIRYLAERDVWVKTFISDVLEWGTYYKPSAGGIRASSLDGQVVVEATGRLVTSNAPEALLVVVEPIDDLAAPGTDGWTASAIDRGAALLRSSNSASGDSVPVAMVTDGRWWALVWASGEGNIGSGTFDGALFLEEPDLRDAFWALARLRGLAGGAEPRRLLALLAASVASTEEITDALGRQVRSAVELLVQSFSESHLRSDGDSPLPDDGHEVYNAAVTVMMRVVFLLFAEANELLPDGELFHRAYAISGVGDELDERVLAAVGVEGEELLEGSYDTWHRVLATSRALFEGATFEDLRMPAYGGSLFDPERFAWLSTTDDTSGRLRVLVDDRVMLQVLRAVQHVRVSAEDRLVSFRELDVEQIGYVYEGLLGYSARYIADDDVIVGLGGPEPGSEPEIPLSALHDIAEGAGDDAKQFATLLLAWVKEDQPGAKARTALQIAKAYEASGTVPVQDEARRLLRPVVPDPLLVEEMIGYIGLIRRDLRGLPYVVQGGGLVVVETRSRATSGTHYTPRSLAEEVVLHALEPLIYSPGPLQTDDEKQWVPISASQILELKVADIAVGSGAFLVAAARYLGRALLAAWDRERSTRSDATAEERRLREVEARREVIARCLYGADINAMAVEMCKLSLWLVSLDPDRPFSFVDDKIFCGNSLLGLTDVRQLRGLHMDPSLARLSNPGFTVDVDAMLERATELRHQLAVPVSESDTMRSIRGKQSLMRQLDANNAVLRDVADGVIAVGLTLGGRAGKALDEAYENLSYALMLAFPPGGGGDKKMLDGILARGLTPTVFTDYPRWKPLHWALEVPDVMVERGGFDVVIGNPPFLGGTKISTFYGGNYRDWLFNTLGERRPLGRADLVAFFFLEIARLTHLRGSLALLASKTISQGETRQMALDTLESNGWVIYRCVRSEPWPARGANVEYAAVWSSLAPISDDLDMDADGIACRKISTLLEPEGRVSGQPRRLRANRSVAFLGSYVHGDGFVLSLQEGSHLIALAARYAEVVRPYLTAKDMNKTFDSAPSRMVIDFREMDESEARAYPLAWRIVEDRVRPERVKQDAIKYPTMVSEWWKHWRPRPELYASIARNHDVLAIARVSKTAMPLKVTANQVFSDAVVVFSVVDPWFQATLSSSLHQFWFITYGSGMRADPRYTPSTVFETFPLPLSPSPGLAESGFNLETTRAASMRSRRIGATDLYNMVNDETADGVDLNLVREAHAIVDENLVASYGWNDIELHHGFHQYRGSMRYSISPAARVELMDRLLQENLRRAEVDGDVGGLVQDDDMTDALADE